MTPFRQPPTRIAFRIGAGLRWRVDALCDKLRDKQLIVELFVRRKLRLSQSERRLIRDSQIYWNGPAERALGQHSHWRNVGIFADDARWLAMGQDHMRLYREFARVIDDKRPLERIVEWGCGGGMNAVHFGKEAREFYGVDISPASLEECGRQMASAGLNNFRAVHIDAIHPELALQMIPNSCDLFISTYVFELLPTPEYGIRVLKIAFDLLRPGGIAIIQVKYNGGDWRTETRGWGYARNL